MKLSAVIMRIPAGGFRSFVSLAQILLLPVTSQSQILTYWRKLSFYPIYMIKKKLVYSLSCLSRVKISKKQLSFEIMTLTYSQLISAFVELLFCISGLQRKGEQKSTKGAGD